MIFRSWSSFQRRKEGYIQFKCLIRSKLFELLLGNFFAPNRSSHHLKNKMERCNHIKSWWFILTQVNDFYKPLDQEYVDPCYPLWFSISSLHKQKILKQVPLPTYHQQDPLENWNWKNAASDEQPVKYIILGYNPVIPICKCRSCQ